MSRESRSGDDVPLLSDDSRDTVTSHDDHYVCNIEGPIVKDYGCTFRQQLRELLSLVIYYTQFGCLLALLVLLFQAGSWQWGVGAVVLMAVHHIVLATVLMVRNGWVNTAWNYCCGVFMFNPMEGFDFLEEGCVGIVIAGACWVMYLALAFMGLGFLSYCLLCYLVTALVFSLLLMDLSMLACTLLHSAQLLQPAEVLYVENYRASRLIILAAFQSAPLLLLGLPALAAAAAGAAAPPRGAPTWLLATVLAVAAASVADAVLLVCAASHASGTSVVLYLAYVMQLRAAVKVPSSLMGDVVRDMVRADGVLRVAQLQLEGDSWPDGGCQMVPAYLLPADADRLESCQLVAAVREACGVVAAQCAIDGEDSCNRMPMPRLILEGELGTQHTAEVLLLGLKTLRGLESVWVLGGYLGGYKFAQVGQEMGAHFFLSELRLVDVHLDATALRILGQLLAHSIPLMHLELVRSVLPVGRGAAAGQMQAGFFAALGSNSSLKYLSLAGSPLEASALSALCKVLCTNTTLTHLDLSFTSMAAEGAQTLAAALRQAPPTLQHLAFAPSDATPLGTAALIRTAQALHLNPNPLPFPTPTSPSKSPTTSRSPTPPPSITPSRAPSRPPSPVPNPLSLTCHDTTEAIVPVGGLPGVVFVCLQDYMTLTSATWLNRAPPPPRGDLSLYLLCHEDSVSTLVQAPLLLPGLASMDLSGLALTESTLSLLTSALQAAPGIQWLDLSDTGLDDIGVELLAAALLRCPSLRTLRLNAIAVGDAGGLALAQAAQECPQLQELQLLHNLHPLAGEILLQLQQTAERRPGLSIQVVEAGDWGEIPISARATAAAAAVAAASGRDSGGGGGPSSVSGSGSSKSECGICCDSCDTIAIQSCQHHVCASCYRHIQQTSGSRHPFSCPYCRAPIRGYRYLRVPPQLEAAPLRPASPGSTPDPCKQISVEPLTGWDAITTAPTLLPAVRTQ